MDIKTDSGIIKVNKKSSYTRFLLGYLSTGAFSGCETLSAARIAWDKVKTKYPGISAYNAGVLVGEVFKIKSDVVYDHIVGPFEEK